MTVPTTDSAMYRAMHRQPDDLRRILGQGWNAAGQATDLLAGAERVFLVGIGTSFHAALVGGWLLRAAGLDARPVLSFDFASYPEQYPLRASDAVVVLAHTGVKRYSAEAMARAAEAGATILSVGSLTAEHPGSRLVLRTVERETSAAYTASHLAAMTVLAQTVTLLGERRSHPAVAGFRAALDRLPDQVAAILAREREIKPLAEEGAARRVYVAAAGPNEATALEAVIKTREAAHGQIDALALEQFLHGPMVAVNSGDLVALVHVPGAAAARTAEVAAVATAIGARLWLVGDPVPAAPDATVFALPAPALPEILSPLLAVVPMQLFAYHMAAHKGIHPDTFRRDDPTYAAAFALLQL